MKRTQFKPLLTALLLAASAVSSEASIAYGSINNFDTVNDTGHECHGFEIELEDCHSTGISYTYNYNHYGVPKITEDNSIPGHPKCIFRSDRADRWSQVHQSKYQFWRRTLRSGLHGAAERDSL